MKITDIKPWGFLFQKSNVLEYKTDEVRKIVETVTCRGDRDTVTISFWGQNSNSRIRNLMEQKQSLLERKNQWVNSALENGQDIKSIHDMLEVFWRTAKRTGTTNFAGNGKAKQRTAWKGTVLQNDEPKTKQEIEQEKISNLVDLSSGMSQIKDSCNPHRLR